MTEVVNFMFRAFGNCRVCRFGGGLIGLREVWLSRGLKRTEVEKERFCRPTL